MENGSQNNIPNSTENHSTGIRTKAAQKTFQQSSSRSQKKNKSPKKLTLKSDHTKLIENNDLPTIETNPQITDVEEMPSKIVETKIVIKDNHENGISVLNLEDNKTNFDVMNTEVSVLNNKSHEVIAEPMIIDFETQPNYIDMSVLVMNEKINDENQIQTTIDTTVENSNDVDHNSVFDETQSTVSEEIPSPPFETVVPASATMDNYSVDRMVSCNQVISPSPFDEIIDPKSFGTLENDSSISEMENVERCVNEKYHEDNDKALFNECDGLNVSELNFSVSNNKDTEHDLYHDEIRYNMLLHSSSNISTTTHNNKTNKRRIVEQCFNMYNLPETMVSTTTVPNNQAHIANPIIYPGTNNSALKMDYNFSHKHKKHMKDKDKESRKQKKSKPKYTIGYIPVPKSKSLSQKGLLAKDNNSEIPSSSSINRSNFQAPADKRSSKTDDNNLLSDLSNNKQTKNNRATKNSFHSVFMDDLFKPEKSNNLPTRKYKRRQGGTKKTKTKTKKSFDTSLIYSKETDINDVFVPPDVTNLMGDSSVSNNVDSTLQFPAQNAMLHDNNRPSLFDFITQHTERTGHHDLLPTANCNYNLSLIEQQRNSNER